MRDTYGKQLMYIMMDTESFNIKSELRVSFAKPILTVTAFLKAKDSLEVLQDPLWITATQSISNDTGDKTKKELAAEVAQKLQAEAQLCKKYVSGELQCCSLRVCLCMCCRVSCRIVYQLTSFPHSFLSHLTSLYVSSRNESQPPYQRPISNASSTASPTMRHIWP
jgi:hypothetical protein